MQESVSGSTAGVKFSGLWNKYFIIMLFCGMVANMAGKYFESTMALHIEELHGPATFTGTLMTCFTIAAAVCRIVGGNLADRKSRRFVMMLGCIVFIIPCVGMAVFPNDFALLIVFRTLQGAGFALVGAGFAVGITDAVPESRMGEGVGYYALSTAVASAVGPIVALAVLSAVSFRGVSVTAVITLLIAFVGTAFFCRYETDKNFAVERSVSTADEEEDLTVEYRGIWKILERRAIKSAILVFFLMLAGSATLSYLTLFAQRHDVGNAALFFTFSAAAMVVVRLVAGKINDKYGMLAAMIPGSLLMILCYVFLILATKNPILYYIAGVSFGLGNGLVQPALNAEAVRGVSPKRRGAAIATYNLPIEISISIGSLLWGIVIDSVGFTAVFMGCIACIVVLILLSVVFFTHKKPARE